MIKEINVAGTPIWTEALGEASGTPVLLIAGAGAHAHFWRDQFCVPLLDKGFFIIRYDHRDVGLSSTTRRDYDLQRLTDDVIAILDAYNISAAHIVGHSMGGYIGQMLAAQNPERMLSLTLISAGPVGEIEALRLLPSQAEKGEMEETWRIMLSNRPTQLFYESYPGFLPVWKRLNGAFEVDEAIARPYTEEMYTRSKHSVGAHKRHVDAMQKMALTLKDRKEIFAQITLPTLIIHGEEDHLVPLKRGGKALADVLPHARLEVIPKMGHMLFDQTLEAQVAESVAAFLVANSS